MAQTCECELVKTEASHMKAPKKLDFMSSVLTHTHFPCFAPSFVSHIHSHEQNHSLHMRSNYVVMTSTANNISTLVFYHM